MTARFDVSITKKWRLDKRNRLIVDSTPTRSGIFTYFESDGQGGVKKVNELRHPDEVFSRDTLDSLNGVPYTTQSNHVSLMTTEDTTGKTFGFTLSGAKRTDDHSDVKLKVHDKKEIDSIMGGKSLELSCGYECDIVKEAGEYNGERYDQRQTNIVYDHVARVEKARGGESCRIRLDSESAICGIEAERLDHSGDKHSHKEENMTVEVKKEVILEKDLPARVSADFRLDADSVKVPQEHVAHVTTMLGREEKLFTELEKVNSANTEKQVKLDAQGKELEGLKKQIENTIPTEKFDSEMEKRLATWDLAKEHKIKDFKTMPAKDLNVEIAKSSKLFNEERMDDEQYVNFCIEHLQTEQAKNVSRSRKNLETHQSQKFDAFEDDISKPSALEMA